MGSSEQIIPVVDLQDEIIGYKPRAEITTDDIYRVSACWVIDAEGNILLAQRAFTKKHNPGKRGPAVAGTVQQGETYLDNILKEIQEEIGIYVEEKDLILGPKVYRADDRKYFGQRFIFQYLGPKEDIKFEVGAIEQLQWFSPEELKQDYSSNTEKYLQSVGWCIENFS